MSQLIYIYHTIGDIDTEFVGALPSATVYQLFAVLNSSETAEEKIQSPRIINVCGYDIRIRQKSRFDSKTTYSPRKIVTKYWKTFIYTII